jgi:peptidoglycan/LPS O-acetylase OafA/YrhL
VTATNVVRRPVEATGPAGARPHFTGFESLRAVAALMVVVHHAASLAGPDRSGPFGTPAAVMDGGVAVFFVLSGFLIYRPFVAHELAGDAHPRWVGFWWRRLLRIVPAYWAALTFFWMIGAFHLGADWWRYYLFAQIYSRETVLGGIVQAWSLCTEITFYLLVPLWAGLVARVAVRAAGVAGRAGVHLAGCAALGLGAVVSRLVVEQFFPAQRGLSFNWLPTNLDLFATGMALAALSAWAAHDDRLRVRLDRLAGPVWPWWTAGTALFVWYAYRIGGADIATGYSGWFWHRRQLVFALVTALVLVPAVFGDQTRGLARRAWGWRPVVWMGSVSYGLYLWHLDWMERSVGSLFWPGWVGTPAGASNLAWLLVVGIGIGLISAAASWYLVEEPLQRFRGALGRGPRPRVLGADDTAG